MRLGLTGGIGSGKSTVAALLARYGAQVLDADALSKSLTAAGGAAIAPIAQTFGAQMITPQGALDRDRMRELVFADPQAKARLEAIIHPLVRHTMAEQTAQALNAGAACVVLDIPLLVESGHWREQLDRVLVIDCSEATQIARVHQRSALDEGTIHRILATQASRLQRLQAADCVIFNDGIGLDTLAELVGRLARQFGL